MYSVGMVMQDYNLNELVRLNPLKAAYNLLGKILVINSRPGRIVDIEVYCVLNDPACHSHKYVKEKDIKALEPGELFLYPVHGYWMLNIVVGETRRGLVFIRRVSVGKCFEDYLTGPGIVSKYYAINRELNGVKLGSREEARIVSDNFRLEPGMVKATKRVGLRKDLDARLRFFIPRNIYRRFIQDCKDSTDNVLPRRYNILNSTKE